MTATTRTRKRAAWREARLGEILPLKYGKARSEQFGYPRPETSTFGSNGAFGTFPRALTKGPAILVGRKGAAGTVHYSAEPCWPIDTTFYTEGNDGAFLPFFRYLLESLQLVRLDRSTAIPSLSRDDYDSKVIQYPESIDDQKRIVAEIEKQFTRLEVGVAALRRVQANLKRYRAAVLKAACEGRLVPTEAELAKAEKRKFETGEALLARILAERRQWFDSEQADAKAKKKYVEPIRPETTNLPSLPEDWTWGTWNQVSNWVTYGFTRPMPHVEAGVPIITAKGVNRGRICFEGAHLTTKDAYATLSEKDRPQSGDILITKDGTIGRAAVVDSEREFCINQSVAVIWLRSCPMERKFMLAVIESELTQKPIWAKARGVAIQHLSITDFAKMALPIPPLAEQKRIVAEVERRLSVIEELEAVVSDNLKRATRLRQSILQKAFTGELTNSN